MPILQTDDSAITSMQGIHVYHFFMSNCAQRVNLALAEKGLNWTPHSVNLLKRENTQPAFLKVNPKGLVPTMVHDGVVITESIDILRYIEEQFGAPPLYPSDAGQREQVDKWMNLATENHNAVVKRYMYALAFGRSKTPEQMKRYRQTQADPELIEFHRRASDGFSEQEVLAAERALFAFYDQLEHELSQHTWVVGDEFSYADIAWFVQYFLMSRTGMINFTNYPKIQRWGSALMQRPAFKRGIRDLQPWNASLICKVLALKSFIKRRRFAPKKPR